MEDGWRKRVKGDGGVEIGQFREYGYYTHGYVYQMDQNGDRYLGMMERNER